MKINQYPEVSGIQDTDLMLLDTSTGTKVINGNTLKTSVSTIDDPTTSLSKTWSSKKISDALTKKASIDDKQESLKHTWSSKKINEMILRLAPDYEKNETLVMSTDTGEFNGSVAIDRYGWIVPTVLNLNNPGTLYIKISMSNPDYPPVTYYNNDASGKYYYYTGNMIFVKPGDVVYYELYSTSTKRIDFYPLTTR